jgi:hypothetical protein
MTFENAVFKWIGERLSADSALSDAVPGGVHRGLAPEGTQRPLITMATRGGAPTNGAACVALQEVIVSISVESVDGNQDTDAEAAVERVFVLLDHAIATQDGYRMRCIPSGTLPDVPRPAEGTSYYRQQGRLWRVKVTAV